MEVTKPCCQKECEETSEKVSLGKLAEDQRESVLKISGADCSDEVKAIKKALGAIGVTEASVNLMSSTVTVQHNKALSLANIRQAIETTGVKVVESDDEGFVSSNRKRISLVASAGFLLLIGLILEWTQQPPPNLLLAIFSFSTILAGALVFPKALRAIKQKSLDMNVLMSVAVLGAFAIQEYSEGATVVFLFSFAELLEAFSVSRARQAIKAVLKLTPQIAQVRRDDAIVTVPVVEITPGEQVLIRPGENIPLDGQVTEGSSTVNQAPLTGESLPVEKKAGDFVFAGTINENGALSITVTKGFQDTKISRVIRMIEEAQEQKAPAEQFVDRFAKIYTPVVFALAVVVAVLPPLLLAENFDVWFYRALVLLVIACPCALVLATPISVVSGLASLARMGVLVKGGKYLEALGKLRAVALDKTGTLTEGKFRVLSFERYGGMTETETLGIALSLESLSTHPLAKAVIEYSSLQNASLRDVTMYVAIPGRGAEGWIGDHLFFVGNHRLTHELGVCTPELEKYLATLEDQSLSVVIVGHKPHDGHAGKVLAVFGLGDTLKANAKDAIAALHESGISKVVVLSGDNQKTVDAICRIAGIDLGKGDLLPEDKVAEVKSLTQQYKFVAMVGDGVNDAPALANATVGISMGGAGTDTAIETSDVSLMQDDLSQLPKAIKQGRRVLRVIQFNIGFAMLTKLVFLVLAIVGISNLWLAVAADMGASLFVTLNALRLLRTKELPK